MKCPKCDHEPRDRLLCSPCPNPDCSYIWWDTESYVRHLARGLGPIGTVLDIGCGQKGVIAQAYWEDEVKIRKGYAVDIFCIKPLPPVWEPLLMDAEGLLERLGPNSVDVVTHCGFLEHLDYEKALRVLRVIEQVAKKLIYFSCSGVLREVAYKVKKDKNPFHFYRSFWDASTLQRLGYVVDVPRMADGKTFRTEVQGWFYKGHTTSPWPERRQRAEKSLAKRKCRETGCAAEPVAYDPVADSVFCLQHVPYRERFQDPENMPPEIPEFPRPPKEWR